MTSITSTTVQFLFASQNQDPLTSILTGGAQQTASPAQALAALEMAKANEAREVDAKLDDPQVQRELARFIDKVQSAKTPEELLEDPIARRVLLTANGLGEQSDALGLAKQALLADLSDEESLPYRLQDLNPAWLSTAKTYDFANSGLAVLRDPDTLGLITDAYAQVRWREHLDKRAPGLSNALSFIKSAASFKNAIAILGTGFAREVVTVAYGVPKQLALQSLTTQEKVINDRIDVERLQDPSYAEEIARRYLIALNGSGTGSFTSVLA